MKSTITAWFRSHRREVLLALLTVLISTASFASGYLFARDTQATPIIINQ